MRNERSTTLNPLKNRYWKLSNPHFVGSFLETLVNRIRLKGLSDMERSAFSTSFGHYEWVVMPFWVNKCSENFSTYDE
jgi:hypothetical protein